VKDYWPIALVLLVAVLAFWFQYQRHDLLYGTEPPPTPDAVRARFRAEGRSPQEAEGTIRQFEKARGNRPSADGDTPDR
jgi:hypothetical protein